MATVPIVQRVVCAAVILNDKNEILLIQRSATEDVYPNLWELPSGRKEPLEPTLAALKREVKEEVGVEIEVLQPLSVFDYLIEKPDQIRDTVQINFLTRIYPNQTIRLSSEHQAFAWVNRPQLHLYQVTEKIKEAIKIAFDIIYST